jgi:hypothetical protein
VSEPLATRIEREEFRVWRRVPNYSAVTQVKDGSATNRRWTTRSTRAAAEEEVARRQKLGDKSLFGIERVHVAEESDGIEWLS